MITIAVVVGTYNRRDRLQSCLEALSTIRVPHEVIAIDAGSTDGTWEMLRAFPAVRRVQDGERLGQATSYNRVFLGLESAYTCWLSDDNIVATGMLDVAVEILTRNLRIGMVALKTKDVTGPFSALPYIGGIWPSGVLNCNQGVIRTDLLKRLGGFDESFRDYGIDSDLTTRVLLSGYAVAFTQQVAVYHQRDHESDSWIDSSGRSQRLEAALVLYRRKFAGLIANAETLLNTRLVEATRGTLFRLRGYSSRVSRLPVVSRGLRRYCERDWDLISRCPFISAWDLVRNSQRPYYLVQRIPDTCRGIT